ncbi:MAG TPA: HEAT repeat domain-containing protein [Gemmatimonadales bacterium]|nr:HEAT repeat domain-containing protein [Gemmatimonadales bacterium]
MQYLQFGLALAAMAGLGESWIHPVRSDLDGIPAVEMAAYGLVAIVPAPWLQGDAADSLYRRAREMLNRRDYRSAASLFGQIPERFPRSGYAPDAFYWQAFALYRIGGDRELRQGLEALGRQRDRFPKAATQGDAASLERRIQGELAQRGDPDAAADIARAAEAAGGPGVPVPPVPPVPPAPPTPPEPRGRHVHEHGGCSDNDDDMKVAALNALQQMDEAKARPVLRKVLARRDTGSVCLRRKAVFLVAQQKEPGTEDLLLESVRTDPDSDVRGQAVFWLSQVGTERAVGALDSILRFSKDAEIQDKAVFALSQQDNPRAQQALRSYAEREGIPEGTREKAIFWLGQHQSAENATYLRSLYGKLKSQDLKKKVLFSLSQMGGEENGRWLLRVAGDTSQGLEMRKQALFWAGQGGVSIDELTKLYAKVSDKEMREQLIFVYSQRDEPAALDKLIEIAKSDPNPDLKKRALFWLGQSEDSRAVQALQDIIEQP